ncbi:MAG: transposase [Verrucomicrobiaceae bacterium]|nr:transposase [Verrucomicrobiaceae bacterium]
MRKQISRRSQAGGKLLFDDLPDYRFSLYVTNLDLPLDQIWYIYNTRADCENRIKELKQDFGLDAFCLQELTRSPPHGSLALRAALRAVCLAARRAARLWATEASFRFIMVAYNLMSLFRRFGLNSHNQATLATLRSYYFAIGGWVRQHARKRVLKLSLPGKKRPWMDAIFRQIEARPPPFAYSIA